MKHIPQSQLKIRRQEPWAGLEAQWQSAAASLPGKLIVLDDDPTGVQTVHGVPVYTSWEEDACAALLEEESRVVFLLTNSRAMGEKESIALHRSIAENIKGALARKGMGKDQILLVLRGDSTLRGHYPAEMDTLKEAFYGAELPHGEIHIPAFFEGGRYTIHGVHYLLRGDTLIPVGETEFAKDPLFAYKSSAVGEWIREKRGWQDCADNIVHIDLDLLRSGQAEDIAALLLHAGQDARIIVDAVDDWDLRQFCIGLAQAMQDGRRYLFRTAASAIGMLGGIPGAPLLRPEEINPTGGPGLVIVGSFVNKTTEQLKELQREQEIYFYEADVQQVLARSIEEEAARAAARLDAALEEGQTACLYTSRGYYGAELPEAEKLRNSKSISDFLVETVRKLTRQPGYLIAKGGITSSDIGVKGLGVRRAMVAGQAAAGVPVWNTGKDSLFPGMRYVIFPGNVGESQSLRELVRGLEAVKESKT